MLLLLTLNSHLTTERDTFDSSALVSFGQVYSMVLLFWITNLEQAVAMWVVYECFEYVVKKHGREILLIDFLIDFGLLFFSGNLLLKLAKVWDIDFSNIEI